WKVDIQVSDQTIASNRPISNPSIQKEVISFTIQDQGLPLLAPTASTEGKHPRMMHIKGLKKGYYSLTVDGQPVASASAKEWAKGVEIKHGPVFTQSKELKNLILKKNELYFHK